MHRNVIRVAVAVALALAPVGVVTGVAEAKPDYGHVSGDGQPGRVVARAEHSSKCGGGPSLVLRNSAGEDDAKRSSGNLGTYVACVTQAAYDSHPVGTWFNNMSGVEGTVG